MSSPVSAKSASPLITQDSRTVTARLCLLVAIVGLADFVFGATYVNLLASRGMSTSLMGVAFFAATVVGTLVEIPSGDLGDRVGQRLVGGCGLVVWGASLIILAAVVGGFGAFLSLIMWQVGQALYSGAPISLSVNLIAQSDVVGRTAVVRYSNVVGWLASASGGVAVFFATGTLSPSLLILCSGMLLFVAGAWMILWWPAQRSVPSAERSVLPQSMIERVRLGWSRKLSRLLTLVVLNAACLSVLLFAWQLLLSSLPGDHGSYSGVFLFGMALSAALGSWLTRFDSSLHGRLIGIPVAIVAAGVGLVWSSSSMDLGTLAAAFAVTELACGYGTTLAWSRAHQSFEDHSRNLFSSLFSACSATAMGVTDLWFGYLADVLGVRHAVATGGAAFAVVATVVCIVAFAGRGFRRE